MEKTSEKPKNTIKTKGMSFTTNAISPACELCLSGKKSVLFITGKCGKDCYYCPISQKRKNKDCMWINEKLVEKNSDIIEEIEKCQSRGVGITGGEPLLDIKKTAIHIKLLKKHFGKRFNIHLYTCRDDLKEEELKTLYDSGLDEIRFHSFTLNKTIKTARRLNWIVSVEIPIIPKKIKNIINLIADLDKEKIDFINLNELEFSDTNAERMKEKGFELTEDELYSVKGSYETVIDIMESIKRPNHISVHFCTSDSKYQYQYWNRLKNRAKNIRKEYEIVLENGLLKKGVIFKKEDESLEETASRLRLKKYSIEKKDNEVRIETTTQNARLAAIKKYKSAVVLEIPSADPFDLEVTFFDSKGHLMD